MDRLISEFEVIRAVEKYTDNIFTKNMGDLVNDIKAIPPAEPKWIPVSERLPKTTEDVLVMVNELVANDREISIGFYGYINPIKKNLEWLVYEEYSNDVVAWMPLPKPYEQQKRSNKE